MSLKKLDKAFLKLEKTQKELSATDEFNIELMEQFNKSMKDVTNALDEYYNKPSLIKRAFRLLF